MPRHRYALTYSWSGLDHPSRHGNTHAHSPQRKGKKRSWSLLDYGVNWAEVKDIALPILERYTARTNGSSVRLRDPGIAWSYYSTDPEWGLMQAKSVIVELEEALAAHDVRARAVLSAWLLSRTPTHALPPPSLDQLTLIRSRHIHLPDSS